MSRSTRSIAPILNLLLVAATGGIALLSAAAGASILPANVVNVDFNTTDQQVVDSNPAHNTTVTPAGTYTGLAAGPATAGTAWNGEVLGDKDSRPIKLFHSFSSGALTASDGTTPTAITVSLTNVSQYDTTEVPLTDTSVRKLMDDYAFADTTTPGSFTISGLDGGPATYDLYLYSENGGYTTTFPPVTTFTIGATSHIATNTGAENPNVFTQNKNYVVFTGLTGGPSHEITGTFIQSGSNGTFNGFQLVETVTPEPASMAMLVCGSVTLLRRRKRG